MIYEYPEEFVVPFKYVDDLKDKPEHRAWKIKYLNMDDLTLPNQTVQSKILESDDKYSFKMDDNLWEQPYKEYILEFDGDFGHKKDNSILGEIDNEYANSESLR